MRLDPDTDAALRRELAELKFAAQKCTLALAQATLLVELHAWAHTLHVITSRIVELDLPFEVLATTVVRIPDDLPGQVTEQDLQLLDLDEVREALDLRGRP